MQNRTERLAAHSGNAVPTEAQAQDSVHRPEGVAGSPYCGTTLLRLPEAARRKGLAPRRPDWPRPSAGGRGQAVDAHQKRWRMPRPKDTPELWFEILSFMTIAYRSVRLDMK